MGNDGRITFYSFSGKLPEINAYLVRISEPSISAIQYEAKACAGFDYAEPNYYVRSTLTPNDPQWTLQWGLPKVRAGMAWDIELGTRSIIVAVVDTGIDYLHEDLAANYVPLGYDWVNHDNDPIQIQQRPRNACCLYHRRGDKQRG